jgi:CHASE2 domain-containing sensor protein
MSNSTRFLLKDAFLCLVLSISFLWAVSFLLLNLSIFNPFTNAFKDFSYLDIYYSEKMEKNNPAKDIIIINVEKRSRFEISQLINQIKKENPKVIGLDIIFKDQKDPYIDSILASNLLSKNIIISKAYLDGNWVSNYNKIKKETNEIGFTNINFDKKSDIIRTYEGAKKINDTIHFSLTSLIAKEFLDKEWVDYNIVNKINSPIYINYHGNADDFLTFSYDECFQQANLSILKDKIVLLGYLGTPHKSETDIEDKLFTPLNKKNAGKSPPDMFGVVIHANIIQMIINQSFYKVIPKWLIAIIALFFSYLSLLFFMMYSKKNPASYTFIKKIIQLLITVLFLGLSLLLFKNNILLKPEIIIVLSVLSPEFIGLYKIIAKKLNTKYKWKSYFFQY